MIGRRQLAVASPIAPTSLVRGFIAALTKDSVAIDRARTSIARVFGSRHVLLTDSGTSALILALRAVVPTGGVVAFPAYACVDLVAAALYAGVRIRLYDIDPSTLSPDLDSVKSVLSRGVDAVVVAHLFGYAADVRGVQQLATEEGIPVIEDAAQGAGATLGGTRLGGIGELAVASFGRGKGLCAGGGGAILANTEAAAARLSSVLVSSTPHAQSGRGMGGLVKTGIQWALGRPSLYAIPSALPWLHLGEMVYHPASEPEAISIASAMLVPTALALEANDVAIRRANARRLDGIVADAEEVEAVLPISSSTPSYLRYAVRDLRGDRCPEAGLGIVKPYPGTLAQYPQASPILAEGKPTMRGAAELARTLFTLPTHRFIDPRDLASLGAWMRH